MKKLLVFALLLLPVFINAQTDASGELTYDQKLATYAKIRKDPTIPLIMNSLIGFGTGSFSQKDNIGGMVGMVMDSAGIIICGVAFIADNSHVLTSSAEGILAGVGVIDLLVSRIYQILRPGKYSTDMNMELLRKLKLQDPAIIFSISMAGEKKGFTVQERF